MTDEPSVADTGEHSLLLAARLIALQRAQRGIRHGLLMGTGDEAARARLEDIRTEIAHLTAVRGGEPAALAAEAARGGTETGRSALASIKETNTGVAMTALPGELSEEAARDTVRGNLAALNAIANSTDRFAALVAMGSSAEEQPAYRAELYRQSPDVAVEAQEAFIASVQAWEEQEDQRLALASASELPPRLTPMQAAAEAIRAYAGAEQAAEFSYLDTWNPEGLPASHFHERAHQARAEMMAALARLSDADAAQVLSQNPRSDHDGSPFPAVAIEEVRAFRAGTTEPIGLGEELADGWAKELAGGLRAARSEEEFHGLFTALQADPGADQGVILRVAHLLTGEHHTTREAALGAIETEFHTRGQGQEQEHTATRGGGR